MTIKTGDRIPKASFAVMTPEGPAVRTTDEVFKGRKVVLIGVPGAFTPTCSRHASARLRRARRRIQGEEDR